MTGLDDATADCCFDAGPVMGTSQYFEARAGSSQTQSGSSRAGLALKGPNFTTIGRDIPRNFKKGRAIA